MARVKDKECLDKWVCNHCNQMYAQSEVQCDHIRPIRNATPQNEDEFIESLKRLHSDGLQILCKKCHKAKTKKEIHDHRKEQLINNISSYLNLSADYLIQYELALLSRLSRYIIKVKTLTDEKEIDRVEKSIDKIMKKHF